MSAEPKLDSGAHAFESASDEQLLRAIADGDLAPLGELFDRHHAAVRAFAERLLQSSADAADLVQETFLTASRAAQSFQPGAPARPFLLGIAAQIARRKRRSFARLRSMLEAFAREPSAHPNPEQVTAAGEEVAVLNAALAQLSHAHREVLLLVDLGGLSGVDAAQALQVPAGTVWRRLHEARFELRERIKRRIK
ncbi:MAG TPA: RNA polymerase sigma factor [Polyangiaceae bacterium]|nr:RNA polymerase sigma factor [Polyangiaceae bacterium]